MSQTLITPHLSAVTTKRPVESVSIANISLSWQQKHCENKQNWKIFCGISKHSSIIDNLHDPQNFAFCCHRNGKYERHDPMPRQTIWMLRRSSDWSMELSHWNRKSIRDSAKWISWENWHMLQWKWKSLQMDNPSQLSRHHVHHALHLLLCWA